MAEKIFGSLMAALCPRSLEIFLFPFFYLINPWELVLNKSGFSILYHPLQNPVPQDFSVNMHSSYWDIIIFILKQVSEWNKCL